jgi:hypothetical protein
VKVKESKERCGQGKERGGGEGGKYNAWCSLGYNRKGRQLNGEGKERREGERERERENRNKNDEGRV